MGYRAEELCFWTVQKMAVNEAYHIHQLINNFFLENLPSILIPNVQ